MTASFELDGFEPISRLGGGGFGDVWLARQTNVDRQVAIKVGHSAIQDETIKLRFERECKALGRLSGHPNIVDVYTAGSLRDGRPYLVLEYISGGTLWQLLKKGPIPEADLISIGTQLSAALDVAHSSGVLHRDLKPENILIRGSGEAVLGDFGIARLHDGQNTTSAAITASVAYAAPEILSGKSATVASDLYGIGVCLLAAVFRSVPFVHKTDESIHPIINRVLTDRPPDCRRAGVSDGLAAIIDSLLDKDPRQRPTDAAEVLNRFKALAAAPPATAGSATRLLEPTHQAGVDHHAAAASPAAAPMPDATIPQTIPPAGQVGGGPIPPGGAASFGSGNFAGSGPVSAVSVAKTGPNRNIRMFALAYVGTLVVGGLILFLLFRTFGGADDPQTQPDDESQNQSLVSPGAEAPTSTSTTLASTTSTTTAPGPLAVPLDVSDLPFDGQVETRFDISGPGEPTFCDNSPPTDGLVDFVGEIHSTDLGLRELHQLVARFETDAQAGAYVDAYVATLDCDEWLQEGDEDADEVDITYQADQISIPTLGDASHRFDVTGATDQNLTAHVRIVLVQQGVDVLVLAGFSLSADQADELAGLAPVAALRLG